MNEKWTIGLIGGIFIMLVGVLVFVGMKGCIPETLLNNTISEEYYYYSSGSKIFLNLDSTRFLVKYIDDASDNEIQKLNGRYNLTTEKPINIAKNQFILKVPDKKRPEEFFTHYGDIRSGAFGDELVVEYATPIFDYEDGTTIILTNQFSVAFKASVTEEEIISFNTQHNVEIVERKRDNNYLLKVTKNSDKDAMSMANLYYESPLTNYAVPSFIRLLHSY